MKKLDDWDLLQKELERSWAECPQTPMTGLDILQSLLGPERGKRQHESSFTRDSRVHVLGAGRTRGSWDKELSVPRGKKRMHDDKGRVCGKQGCPAELAGTPAPGRAGDAEEVVAGGLGASTGP